MNDNKSIASNSSKMELELGKYMESDMIALTEENVVGGTWTVVLSVVTAYISANTCPTTACTRAC